MAHKINFTNLIFTSEKIKYFRCLYTIWNKIISFDMRKKKIIQNIYKKMNLNVLGMSL